jgi:hypothetical protein
LRGRKSEEGGEGERVLAYVQKERDRFQVRGTLHREQGERVRFQGSEEGESTKFSGLEIGEWPSPRYRVVSSPRPTRGRESEKVQVQSTERAQSHCQAEGGRRGEVQVHEERVRMLKSRIQNREGEGGSRVSSGGRETGRSSSPRYRKGRETGRRSVSNV